MAKKTKTVNVFAPKRSSDKPYAEKDSKKVPDKSVLDGWYTFSYEAARKKHWDFYVIDQFLRGNHNVRGNPNDNTIVISKPHIMQGSINYRIETARNFYNIPRNICNRSIICWICINKSGRCIICRVLNRLKNNKFID